MKHPLTKFAALSALSSLVLACGTPSPANDAGSDARATCSNNTPRYTLVGDYSMVTATNVSDTCNAPGLTPADLATPRKIALNGDTLEFSSQDGVVFASGPNGCNSATLSFNSAVAGSTCMWTESRNVALTATGDNAVTLQVTVMRTNFLSQAGQTCTQIAPCSIAYTLTMAR
jgi:hypothetical protein